MSWNFFTWSRSVCCFLKNLVKIQGIQASRIGLGLSRKNHFLMLPKDRIVKESFLSGSNIAFPISDTKKRSPNIASLLLLMLMIFLAECN